MKLIEYDEMGDPAQVLKVKDAPTRPLNAGEARVNVLATPIHPSNLLQIAGQYGVAAALPAIPGAEGIGRVIEVAPDVDNLLVGQRVMLAGGSTWRQEIVAPATAFVPLPDVGDFEQMSMLTVNPLTAHLILTDFVDLKPGDWILQSAANSAVGEYIIQLAKKRGLKSVNLVRRDSLVSDLKALGADVVLVDGPELAEKISTATGGSNISLAIDAVGGETFTRMVESLATGGTIVAYGSLTKQPPMLNSIAIIFNDVRVRGFWLSKWFGTASAAEKQAAYGQVVQSVASGALKAKIDSRFSLDQIAEAVTRAAEDGCTGKVLLIPNAE